VSRVGAEDAARSDAVVACVLDVAARGLADRLGATVQANLLRSPADADALADAGVHVRLVKGAYVEATGAHPHGEATDVAFLRLGFGLAERGATWAMATHDGRLREAGISRYRFSSSRICARARDTSTSCLRHAATRRIIPPRSGRWRFRPCRTPRCPSRTGPDP